MAGIALANGVNANQVRRWMRERGIEVPNRRMLSPAAQPVPAFAPEFVQLPLAAVAPVLGDIRIEIRRVRPCVFVALYPPGGDFQLAAGGDE